MIKKFPDGSSVSYMHRLEAATVRALDAHLTLVSKAQRLCAELDHLTLPGRPGLSHFSDEEEDSLITAIRDITHDRET
jgi:hypothetical protein